MPRAVYQVITTIDSRYRDRLRARSIASAVRRTLKAERAAPPLSVSVVITTDATIRDLNERFRGEDRPTDVLSFGLSDDSWFVTPPVVPQLGELVISYQTARRQAREAGHLVDHEVEHLLVHGVLHLLGYDHERARDARAMRAREEAILGRAVH